MSSKKKKRHSIFDDLFGDSLLDDSDLFKGSSTSYSISVVQTPRGRKVQAKVAKDSNVDAVRKQLEKQYPNAEIEIEGGEKKPLIREISSKKLKGENDQRK